MRDPRSMLGTHDVVFITLDTLRFDVADSLFRAGRTPTFARVFPNGWERRMTPGSFTYAAHHAFFAGFLPVPTAPGVHPRLFACAFPGSETIGPGTLVFDAPDVVRGFSAHGYRTVCVGGVGFFNPSTALGRVLPGLFQDAFWSPELSVVDPRSAEHQMTLAARCLRETERDRRIFLFVNVSAIHQPNRFYLPGAEEDGVETHAAALEEVDRRFGALLDALRGPTLVIVCSDHGTAYGEDGHVGHRCAHPVVWTVPYAHAVVG